jgi:hypothetical protein
VEGIEGGREELELECVEATGLDHLRKDARLIAV